MQYGFQIPNNKMLRLFAVLTGQKTYEHAICNPVNLLQINYNFHVELINDWKSITNSIGVSVSRYIWKESIQYIDMYRSCKYRCTDISKKKYRYCMYRYDILQYYLYLVYIKIGTIYPIKQPKYYNISSSTSS